MQCSGLRAKILINSNIIRFILLTSALMLLSSCASRTQIIGDNSFLNADRIGWSKIKGYEKLSPQERVALHSEYQIRYPLNQKAKASIFKQYSWFLDYQRKTLEKWFKRGENYLPHARRVFVERGLPEDLAYLAFIESGYNPYAYSRVRAAGCWQFMSYTGKRFNLRYAGWIDERRDPVRSAEAAATYLKLLYGIFNDWSLAIASYNAGEGKIGRAVRLTGAKNFFELAERNNRLRGRARLARETLNYVPRFMAMVKIAKKHELLGFEPMDFNNAQELLQVKAKGPVSLTHLASSVGLQWNDFTHYNPSFRTKYIPAGQEAYLYVPKANAEALNTYLSDKKVVVAETVIKRSEVSHKVRRGDTLSRLARRYGTTILNIKKNNRLRSNLIRIGQRLVISKEEKVVVAKVLKPMKSKEEQEKAAATETPGEQAADLKPGQLAATSAPAQPVAEKQATKQPAVKPAPLATAKAEEPVQPQLVRPKARTNSAQATKTTVTAAAPVEDAPKAGKNNKNGKALLQGLLGLAKETQKSAHKTAAATVPQIAQAPRAATAPVRQAASMLQKPVKRSVDEWYQMLAKADLVWGVPQKAKSVKAAGPARQDRKYQVPAVRPDKAVAAQHKAIKPEPVPAPSAGNVAVRSKKLESAAYSRMQPPRSPRVANAGSGTPTRYGHSMRRKISKTTYGSRPVAVRTLQKKQNDAPEKNVLETLNSFSRQLKDGFVKFFSWGEEQEQGYKVRRTVAEAARQPSRS